MNTIDSLFSIRTVPCFGDHTYTDIVWRDLVYRISHPHPKGYQYYAGHIRRPPECVNNYYYEGGDNRSDNLEAAIASGKKCLMAEISYIYEEIDPYIKDLLMFLSEKEIKAI